MMKIQRQQQREDENSRKRKRQINNWEVPRLQSAEKGDAGG
jgi:hypothetical protein